MKSRDFEVILEDIFEEQGLIACSLSKVRNKGDTPYQKVSVRPLELRGSLHYQVTYHYAQKELHENLAPKEAEQLILFLLAQVFRQGVFFTAGADWQVLVSKKGVLKVIERPPSRKKANLEHDRAKQYILQEGTPYPFLVELGVMNQAGQVLAKRYHKFRQLNKFLEMVEDCLPALQDRLKEGPLTIVDFGSGKAYLTFALYHYLVEHLGLEVEMIGLDLKEDVVSFGNQVAKRLGYGGLRFTHQDIRDFKAGKAVDMMISLHACDVATDYALAQAVKWRAQIILAVPCCQHEVLNQLDQPNQKVLLEQGIVKERVAALITDAARAKLLETVGYSVQIMEFIDLEHTPKNLLIRAVRQSESSKQAVGEYLQFKEYWNIRPKLELLLAKEG